jgi:plasmid maintenance system antidote protein VapI
MLNYQNQKPFKSLPVAFSLRNAIEMMDWDEKIFAKQMGLPLREAKMLLRDDAPPLTLDNAKRITQTFGGFKPEVWLKQDKDYRLWLAEQAKPATTHKAVSVTLKPARKNTRKTPAIAD